jgi:hypothetical protein
VGAAKVQCCSASGSRTSTATELSVIEAAFKITQGGGGSGVVDELRDALVDTYA